MKVKFVLRNLAVLNICWVSLFAYCCYTRGITLNVSMANIVILMHIILIVIS